jgi:hypothetical protein
MSNTERLHAWSHLVLFLMLFMITLAVMRFSTPTGLAAGNSSITSQGIGDLKPFLTAVGLLMGLIIAAVFVVAHDFNRAPEKAAPKNMVAEANQQHRSLEDIDKNLARIRKLLR